MNFFITISVFLFSITILASGPRPHEPSPDLLEAISEHNQEQALREGRSGFRVTQVPEGLSPFAEYQKTGYVFFDADNYYGYAREIKETIARKLPPGVTLVIYSTSNSDSQMRELRRRYSTIMNEDQLLVIKIPRSGSNSFWTRDNLPVPVWNQGKMSLVDARYYYNFEPDDFIANLFSSTLSKHRYFFEGGNFIANSRGECIVVNRKRSYPGGQSDTGAIPDSIFTLHYGCKKLTRLRHLKGIGHADEVVKFMSDDVVVTDTPQYAKKLRGQGYKVHMLPEPDRRYETYVNSLQVNDTLFVPTFREQGDKKAIAAYKKLNLGLEIVPIPARQLATRGQGGIHCITMNYPPGDFQSFVQQLGATIVE